MTTIYEKLTKAYKVSCPIASLTTSDPAQAVRSIVAALPDCQVVSWDIADGITIPQQSNVDKAKEACATADLTDDVFNLTTALVSAKKLPKACVLVVHNAHRFIDAPEIMQAIWNLRDAFKSPRRMLILMGTSIRLPVELQHDVIELDEPLPTHDEYKDVIKKIASAASIDVDEQRLTDAASASQGLSAFAAEQLAALNLSKAGGISVDGVWKDKCNKINETPGLKVVSSGSFKDVAGVENCKGFLKGILNGRDKPNSIVFVDEIEKALGGSGSDSSGVSQDQLGVLLQWMQDKRATGCIFVGPPGAAKSALAKASGGEASIPTIQLDLGGMKGSLVGESESRIRDALKVVDSVSGGKTLWLATCNSLTALPPELRRRFAYGTWFFDLPTIEERKAIWKLYCVKHEQKAPSKELLAQEWTGAEIESCCQIAWRTNTTLEKASKYIVPVSKAASQQIASLRAGADGRFLSASHEGIYSSSLSSQPVAASAGEREFE
jgi:hypothetical protein